MAIFEVEHNGEIYEVDAPDEATAAASFEAQPSPQMQSNLGELSAMTQAPKAGINAAANKRAADEYMAMPAWKRRLTDAVDLPGLVANGATFGNLDEGAAWVGSKLRGTSYDEEFAKLNRQTENARARQGVLGTGAEILGSIGTGGAAAKGVAKGVGYVAPSVARAFTAAAPTASKTKKAITAALRTGAAGAEGAAQGAATAHGEGQDVGEGATMGGLFGVGGKYAGDLLTGGVDKVAGLFNAKPDRISKEVFKGRAKDAYKEASDAGVWYNPAGVLDLKTKIVKDLTDLSYRPQNMPGVKVVIDDLKKLGPNDHMTYEGLESLRQAVQGGFDPMKPANNLALNKITDRIDELIDSANPAHITMGQGQQAADAANKARQNWSKFRKLDTIDELVDKGYRMGSRMKSQDVAGATRRQLQKIIDNKRLGRGFSKAEKAALNTASGFTPGMQVLDVVQGMLPQGRLGGMIQGALTIGSGFNPLVMGTQAAGMVAGYGAKKWQDKLSEMAIDKFVDLVARGGVAPPVIENAIQKMAKSKADAVRRALMAGMNQQYNQPAER